MGQKDEQGGQAGGWDRVTHRRRCPATDGCATSCPWYRACEAHCMMARCMRYCTVSVRTAAAPCRSARRSIRLSDSPACAALHRQDRDRVQLGTRGPLSTGPDSSPFRPKSLGVVSQMMAAKMPASQPRDLRVCDNRDSADVTKVRV